MTKLQTSAIPEMEKLFVEEIATLQMKQWYSSTTSSSEAMPWIGEDS